MPAPIQRIKGDYRYRILIKVRDADLSLDILHEINNTHIQKNKNTTMIIDINPINMS